MALPIRIVTVSTPALQNRAATSKVYVTGIRDKATQSSWPVWANGVFAGPDKASDDAIIGGEAEKSARVQGYPATIDCLTYLTVQEALSSLVIQLNDHYYHAKK